MHNGSPPKGTRIPASRFSASLKDTRNAETHASRLIEEAKQQAREIVAEAKREAAENNKKLEELSASELRKFIDEDTLRRHAKTFITLLSEVHAFRKKGANAAPWIAELVSTSIKRVLGDMDISEVTARAVRQGIRELHDRQDVKLAVHPDTLEAAQRAKQEYPDLFSAITEIAEDPAIEPDVLNLSCKIGINPISVSGRFESILEIIRTSPHLQNTNKSKQ